MDAVCTIDGEMDCAALVHLAQAGDDDAFDRLARHYRAAVVAVTFSRVGNRDEAEDLAQEVLIKVRGKLCELREPEAFPAWLKTIALNVCRTWYRRFVRWPESLEQSAEGRKIADWSPGPLDVLLARERQREWRRALIRLPDANRLALLMHIWGDYSHAEIASFTGVPVTTIEGRIHRAKAQLRRLLRSNAFELLGEPRPKWHKEDRDDER